MTTAASGEESGSVLDLGEPFVRWTAGEVRAHMARRGVRQAELARRLDVSQQWVSTRMSARVPMTTADLARIARALGTTPMELLSGESRPPGPGAAVSVGADESSTRRNSTGYADAVLLRPVFRRSPSEVVARATTAVRDRISA